MKPDWLRLIRCKLCGKGYLECTYDDQGLPLWMCKNCLASVSREECEATEISMCHLISQVEMNVMMGGLLTLSLRDMKSGIKRIEQGLSPLHFLALKAHTQYVRICASKAHSIEQQIGLVPLNLRYRLLQQVGDPEKLRGDAATFAINQVLKIECIAAECSGCSSCGGNTPHEAVYESATTMFHCAQQDLLQCPTEFWPPNARFMVKRYLPLMKIQFGEQDSDIKNINEKIIRDASVSAVVLNLQASLHVSEVKTPKKKGNKKGRRSTKKKKGKK